MHEMVPGMSKPVSMLEYIAKKEEEVSRLREKSLQELQAELQDTRKKLSEADEKLAALKDDFHYNLRLLEDRDAELENLEALNHELSMRSEEKDVLLGRLRSEAAEMESELNIHRSRAAEAEAALNAKHLEAVELAESARLGAEEALYRAREEFESQRRHLQKSLAEAEEEIMRQRRELGQSFAEQTRALEADYKHRADDALAAQGVAEELAARRLDELQRAQQRIEEVEAACEEAEQRLRSSTWELSNSLRLKDERIAELEGRAAQAAREAERCAREMEAERASLTERLEEAQAASERAEERAAAESKRLVTEREEEVSDLQARLEGLQGRAQELKSELDTAQSALRITRRDLEERLASAEAAMKKERSSWERSLEELQRQHGLELREAQVLLAGEPPALNSWRTGTSLCPKAAKNPCANPWEVSSPLRHPLSPPGLITMIKSVVWEAQEQVWAKDAELSALRDKAESLRETIEERRRDIAWYREQLAASEAREEEARRSLLQAELQAEQREEERQQAEEASSQSLIAALTRQRDDAQAALQEMEAEAHFLQEQLRRATEGIGRPKPIPRQQPPSPLRPPQAESALEHSVRGFRHHPPSAYLQNDTASELLSPPTIPSMPPSPDYAQRARPGPAAPREPDSQARGEPEDLDLDCGDGGGWGDGDRDGAPPCGGSTPEAENRQLRAAVAELEAQRERLTTTVAAMTAEMQQLAGPARKAEELQKEVEELREERLRLEQQARRLEAEAESALAEARAAAEGELSQLKQKLERCQGAVRRLRAENERLMEVGNELRAERNLMAGMLPSSPALQDRAPVRGAPPWHPADWAAAGPELAAAERPRSAAEAPQRRLAEVSDAIAPCRSGGDATPAVPGRSPKRANSSGSAVPKTVDQAPERPKPRQPTEQPPGQQSETSAPLRHRQGGQRGHSADPAAADRGTAKRGLHGVAEALDTPQLCVEPSAQQQQQQYGGPDPRDPSPEKATQTDRSAVSGRASARELPSQKEKLAILKRRNEDAKRPKVRNYNVRD